MLRPKVLEVTRKATSSQALRKITAGHEMLPADEMGISYVLFAAQAQNAKPKPVPSATPAPSFRDPFAAEHLEQDLFVTQVHGTHNLVLNKFNVVDEHVVLPTIEYEEQTMPLTVADCRAMWSSMKDLDAFAFFNCGYESGASQPHKHMQLISYPSMRTYTNLDMPPLLQFIHDCLVSQPKSEIVELLDLPFRHFLHRIDLAEDLESQDAAVQLHGVYMAMLTNMQTAITARPASGFLAYNLLLTPSFLLMVPRREQSFEGVEVNSIGFIGSFFVKNDTQRAFFEQKGPMELLRQVTFPSLPTSTT